MLATQSMPSVAPDTRPGRRVREKTDYLVVHTALTFPDQPCDAATIDSWHRARGFDGIGYHYVIHRDGTVESGRPTDEYGAHTIGYNNRSVGVCLAGGYDLISWDAARESVPPAKWIVQQKPKGLVVVSANYTATQLFELSALLQNLQERYDTQNDSSLPVVLGHRDLSRDGRSCPAFDVKKWWAEIKLGRMPESVPTEW